MDIVCVCDTPLQILNTVQYVKKYLNRNTDNIDIFIYHQFKNSEIISERIKKSMLFRNVYDIRRFKEYSAVVQKLVTLWRMFYPQKFLKNYLKDPKISFEPGYDCFVFAFPTTLVFALQSLYKPAKVIILEDGIGTYVGDITDDYSSGSLRFFRKIFRNLNLSLLPDCYCVRCPEFLSTVDETKKMVLDNTSECLDVLNTIFEYKNNDIYRTGKMVFLTQPLNERRGYLEKAYKKILDVLYGYRSGMIVRKHPRDTGVDYSDFMQDNVDNMWELECCNTICDDHVLIGGFSTAQLMPKILTGAEPALIFLYKLLFDTEELGSAFWVDTTELIRKFKDNYKDKTKILIPETAEELVGILEQYCRRDKRLEKKESQC